MLRCGTTTFNDMYFYPDVIADVVLESGIRGVLGLPLLDFPTVYTSGIDDCLSKAKVSRVSSYKIYDLMYIYRILLLNGRSVMIPNNWFTSVSLLMHHILSVMIRS